ncbi:MAG: cell division protein ZipA C-terminal FtsZ-binding domain-containing protein [Armatimonas sp.]
MAGGFHRFEGELVSKAEWAQMPDTERRIARALGPDPLEDATHLLTPVQGRPVEAASGPDPERTFTRTLRGTPMLSRAAVLFALEDSTRRERLQGAELWGWRWGEWLALSATPEVESLTLAWPLSTIPGNTIAELATELGRLDVAASDLARTLGTRLERVETPAEAAERAHAIRLRPATPALELQLKAGRTPFSSRAIWRTLYSLGLSWGDLDLFHWGEPSLFTVSAIGLRTDFSPERAEEGEGVAGLSLSFEPELSPNPAEVFERMALALAYLREQLGGQPMYQGRELDGEALDRIRATLRQYGVE